MAALSVLSLLSAACARAPEASLPGAAVPLPVGLDTRVLRVVDGDTIVVAGGHSVRLIGVDTPETKDPRRPVQCYGREAAAFLSSLLPKGTAVRLVGDEEPRDVYDRALAYAYRLPDGLFVNAELVRNGYAQVLTIPPNVAHSEEFVALAADARNANRGLWSACSS
ncbi:MAG: thermonuclease family protein [Acidimicrobiales bacterium]